MYTYSIYNLPYVSMTGRSAEKTGWSHNGRRMDVNLLCIFHNGECTFEIEGKFFEAKKGNIILVPKGCFYRPHTNSSVEYTFFQFNGDLEECKLPANELPSFKDAPHTQPIYGTVKEGSHTLVLDNLMDMGENTAEIELLLTKCLSSYNRYNEMLQMLLSIQFCELLFHISQSYCNQFESSDNMPAAVNKIVTYIHNNYTKKITLDVLCDEVNISKQYCMRLFKKYLHTTIDDYVLSTRMKHAAYLLRHTYMNVNEASSYLGFSSVSYFSRVFKRYYGVSPSDYYI